MKEPNRILFLSQEIYPYLAEETPIRMLNRKLPELFQAKGYETRTFMPKFGEINERRNQLHEVIRLSGMNIIIEDTDHPLLLKVASIQSAHIQIYFTDNDDFFHHRKGIGDENGEYRDNDERTIFYVRGAIETVKKLRWTPDIVFCSGWMAALAPLYLKTAYADTPFFTHTKVVLSLDDNEYKKAFSTKFSSKLLIEGVPPIKVRSLQGFEVGYEELMRLAIDNADAIVVSAPKVNQRVMNYAETSGKPILKYHADDTQAYLDFCNGLLADAPDAGVQG
ncbi:MAG: glycogen/starch synthase [Paludibacteraceae bacterium]|nr:glycogen/starch synthase [Paludibacteraceae bacterium]